jgi:oligopeptide/dipeptide ABC transporter ATP-binding protein
VLEGKDVSALDASSLGLIRRTIQMVFQDPLSSLNPRKTVRQIVRLPLDAQGTGSQAERNARVDALLDAVGLSPRFAKLRPAQLSGGQRQRVGIARALAIDPKLIVLDEPTASLDVSVQARILSLLDRLREQRQIALILISHNLGVVRHVSDRVAVMYLGRIVEIGPVAAIFANAQHPYTQALFAAIPALDDEELVELKRGERAQGEIASAARVPSGCAFHPRCPHAMERCRSAPPPSVEVAPGHSASCHLLA